MTDYHDAIIRRLEDAGRTLMMLPMPAGGMPAGERVAWPEVVQNYWDIAGRADQGSFEERQEALAQVRNSVSLRATRAAIGRLDEVLGWLLMIERPHHRKTVMARMFVHPVSERPVHSWGKIAETLGSNRRTVQHWHGKGIQTIIEGLAAR